MGEISSPMKLQWNKRRTTHSSVCIPLLTMREVQGANHPVRRLGGNAGSLECHEPLVILQDPGRTPTPNHRVVPYYEIHSSPYAPTEARQWTLLSFLQGKQKGQEVTDHIPNWNVYMAQYRGFVCHIFAACMPYVLFLSHCFQGSWCHTTPLSMAYPLTKNNTYESNSQKNRFWRKTDFARNSLKMSFSRRSLRVQMPFRITTNTYHEIIFATISCQRAMSLPSWHCPAEVWEGDEPRRSWCLESGDSPNGADLVSELPLP